MSALMLRRARLSTAFALISSKGPVWRRRQRVEIPVWPFA